MKEKKGGKKEMAIEMLSLVGLEGGKEGDESPLPTSV